MIFTESLAAQIRYSLDWSTFEVCWSDLSVVCQNSEGDVHIGVWIARGNAKRLLC